MIASERSSLERNRQRTGLLEASGRITPREVLAAYESTGYSPAQQSWFDEPVEGHYTACALGVVVAEAARTPASLEVKAMSFVKRRMGRGWSEYVSGFVNGFDDYARWAVGEQPPPYRTGYRDGARARKFCFGSSE